MAATAQCLITTRSASFAAFWDMRQKKDRGSKLVWKLDSGVEHLYSAKVIVERFLASTFESYKNSMYHVCRQT